VLNLARDRLLLVDDGRLIGRFSRVIAAFMGTVTDFTGFAKFSPCVNWPLATDGPPADILHRRVVPPATAMSTTPTRLPLLFSYRDTIFGQGFLVEVKVLNGRALCVTEDNEVWMYGVNPGGMAASGTDLHDAHKEFRKAFTKILIDLAYEAENFDAYRAAVEQFVHETSDNDGWRAAVEEVRRLNVAEVGLPRASADSPMSVQVTIREMPRVDDNLPVSDALLAA